MLLLTVSEVRYIHRYYFRIVYLIWLWCNQDAISPKRKEKEILTWLSCLKYNPQENCISYQSWDKPLMFPFLHTSTVFWHADTAKARKTKNKLCNPKKCTPPSLRSPFISLSSFLSNSIRNEFGHKILCIQMGRLLNLVPV